MRTLNWGRVRPTPARALSNTWLTFESALRIDTATRLAFLFRLARRIICLNAGGPSAPRRSILLRSASEKFNSNWKYIRPRPGCAFRRQLP